MIDPGLNVIDTGIVVKSNDEAKAAVVRLLAQSYGVSQSIIENCISDVTTDADAPNDGEDIYIVHKPTKSNKQRVVYVHFAFWGI